MREIKQGSWRHKKWPHGERRGTERPDKLLCIWVWTGRKRNVTRPNKLQSLVGYFPMSSHSPVPFSIKSNNHLAQRVLPFQLMFSKTSMSDLICGLFLIITLNFEWKIKKGMETLCLLLVSDYLSSPTLPGPSPSPVVRRGIFYTACCFRSWQPGHSELPTGTPWGAYISFPEA